MKTPDEIRKGLKYCSRGDCERGCPYWDNDGIGCANQLREDAFFYIQQLEMTVDAHNHQINRLQTERADLLDVIGTGTNICDICKREGEHIYDFDCDLDCDNCKENSDCACRICVNQGWQVGFEWRGKA